MLTLDDLDHFDDRSIASLFADASLQDDGNAARRRERMLACLRFCRDMPTPELADGGLGRAREGLRGLVRGLRRGRRLQTEDLAMLLEDALECLGEESRRPGQPAETVLLRHALEGAIEAAAQSACGTPTQHPMLLDALARGQFELSSASRLASLEDGGGRFGSPADVDVELLLDGRTLPARVCLSLEIASRLWRWQATDAGAIAFNEGPAELVPGDDGVVRAVVTGLALQNGRTVVSWSRALREATEALR